MSVFVSEIGSVFKRSSLGDTHFRSHDELRLIGIT